MFASDAVEGLLIDRAKNEKAENEIDNLIDDRIRKQDKTISLFDFTNLSIAARLLLLLVLQRCFYFTTIVNLKLTLL